MQIHASEKELLKNPNCPWMWGTLKVRFNTEQEMKDWLNENYDEISKQIYIEQI